MPGRGRPAQSGRTLRRRDPCVTSFWPCGGAFCGTITRTYRDTAEYQSPNLGRQIVIDMAPQGGGNYAGRVWRPSNDKIYAGKASVAGDRMSLSGCIAGGLLCSSQTWVRVQ